MTFRKIDCQQLQCLHLTPDHVVHVTGFTGNMYSIGNARRQAVERLRGKTVLTWGGDHFNEQGFTILVRDFLSMTHGQARVFAFRNRSQDNHAAFKQSWSHLAEQYRGCFHIVEIDAEAEATRFDVWRETQPGGHAGSLPNPRFFLLGRLAVKMLRTTRVVAMGGGGVVGCEMKCGVAYDGAQWTVFALSRGKMEVHASLMDAAVTEGRVELVRGVDPNEAQGFCLGIPTYQFPVPGQLQGPAGGLLGQNLAPQQPQQLPQQWQHQQLPQPPQQSQPPQSPQTPAPVKLPNGAFKCKRVTCDKPSWNGEANHFCTISCRDNPAPFSKPARRRFRSSLRRCLHSNHKGSHHTQPAQQTFLQQPPCRFPQQ